MTDFLRSHIRITAIIPLTFISATKITIHGIESKMSKN